jgi:hypothetical protein
MTTPVDRPFVARRLAAPQRPRTPPTPVNTASIQTTTIDWNSLWQALGTLPAPDRDNLVAGLPPNVRAALARIADVAAAVTLIR